MRPSVKHGKRRFQTRHHELVHGDLLAVELHGTHAVPHVVLGSHRPGSQVEHLHVAVVVPGEHAPLFVVEGVAECDAPAIPRLDPFRGFEDGDGRILLADVPHANAPVAAAGDEFGRAVAAPLTPGAVDGVDDRGVRLDVHERLLRALEIPQLQVALEVTRREVTLAEGGCAEGSALEGRLLLELLVELHAFVLRVERVDLEASRGPSVRAEDHEPRAGGYPFGVVGGDVHRLLVQLQDVWAGGKAHGVHGDRGPPCRPCLDHWGS